MSAAFTPGPWRLDDQERHHNLSEDYHAIDAGPGYYVKSGGFCLTGFMTRADARLIAEAPTMFDLLRRARQQLPLAAASWNEEPKYAANVEAVLALIYEIQAAIANVTGEH